MIPQNPILYYGDAPSPIEAGQRYASHPNELVGPAVIRGFELTSQVTEGTMSGVDGSADVGLVIDGVIFSVTAPADNAALVTGLNAIPLAQTLGIAFTNPAGATLRVSFSDYASHTITAYSPGTPDITAITNTVTASNPQFIPYGCALIRDAASGDVVAAVVPASEYDEPNGFTFAGVLGRVNDRHSDDEKRLLGFIQGVTEGLAPSLHADCVEIGLFKVALASGSPAAVRGTPAYFITTAGANCGKFTADDAGGSNPTATGCRWGRAHAAGAEVGYLEIGVHP